MESLEVVESLVAGVSLVVAGGDVVAAVGRRDVAWDSFWVRVCGGSDTRVD